MEVTRGQKVPTVVLEFSSGLLGLYGVWHCHDEAVALLPVGLDFFCKLHPETSTELHSVRTMQNSYFHQASVNGLTETQNTASITFLADGVNLKLRAFWLKVNWAISVAL
jgi:hypothetical protein